MLRIKSNCLTTKDDTYYFREEPFTGVAFELDNGEVIGKKNYREGIPAGDYVNEYFPPMDNLLHVDDDCLEEDERSYSGEPFCYNGERFTGIAYEFANEFCVSELLYRKGILDSEAGYNQSGRLEVLDIHENGLSQEFVWDTGGEVVKIKLFQKDALDFSIEFDEEHRLKSLVIKGSYFERIDELKQLVRFNIFESKEFLRDCRAAGFLLLSGESIDDEVLQNIIDKGGLDDTKRLYIYNSLITVNGLQTVKSLKDLTELRVKSRDEGLITALRELKESLPELILLFNDEEL